MRLTNDEWALARIRCTKPQLEALDLWRKGFGYKTIAYVLHIHPTTAKARVEAGLNRLDMSVRDFAA